MDSADLFKVGGVVGVGASADLATGLRRISMVLMPVSFMVGYCVPQTEQIAFGPILIGRVSCWQTEQYTGRSLTFITAYVTTF